MRQPYGQASNRQKRTKSKVKKNRWRNTEININAIGYTFHPMYFSNLCCCWWFFRLSSGFYFVVFTVGHGVFGWIKSNSFKWITINSWAETFLQYSHTVLQKKMKRRWKVKKMFCFSSSYSSKSDQKLICSKNLNSVHFKIHSAMCWARTNHFKSNTFI